MRFNICYTRREMPSASWLGILVIMSLLNVTCVWSQSGEERPTLWVKTNISVKNDQVLLGDLGVIKASPELAPIVDKLQTIHVAKSPMPLERLVISGRDVLERIENAGIPLNAVGYSIPETIIIERAGRHLSNEEVREAADRMLQKESSGEIRVREVQWKSHQAVPVGTVDLKIEKLGGPNAGQVPLRVLALCDSRPVARFLATAIVDDWREVPVLSKTLERGKMISSEDIKLIKLNLLSQPEDIAAELEDVLGKRLKSTLRAGEIIRRNMIDTPPTIERGAKITMTYRNGVFEARALGVAVEDGFNGKTMRVRNESSHKIVEGIVMNEREVRVNE